MKEQSEGHTLENNVVRVLERYAVIAVQYCRKSRELS